MTASTCKACDPETVYGASKLLAERMTLNAGGTVVRFFNVRESSGNVFRIWERVPDGDPLPVADAWRYFISLEAAAQLVVDAIGLPAGRFMVDPGAPRWMPDVAAEEYPGREQAWMPLRRGDRRREPLHARCEAVSRDESGYLRVANAHDAVLSAVAA